MRTTAVGRLHTEQALRRSIADGDLRVHYQQIVTLADGYRPVGHEALVRWMHPRRGLIPPDEFITIAEETGLIVPLGSWVLREACLQAKRFEMLDPRWSRLTMSVNLSGVQLGQSDLIEMVATALRESNLRSDRLQLEMTESVLMTDAANTVTILQQLKGLGVKLGIDDFGTGYSSLAYLRRFPVDVLKIDRTFVNGLGTDLEDSAVAAAIVSLADTLGLTAIAEGVETELQRDCLMGLGCQRAQGYLFARPVAASAAESALGLLEVPNGPLG
jgi:EAL domain-containing protein (putative c-di-GMP-specific phosphodiesterase class I)